MKAHEKGEKNWIFIINLFLARRNQIGTWGQRDKRRLLVQDFRGLSEAYEGTC